jgi:alpha-galactosidase
MKAAKILFLGNSITYHPPAPALGWSGNWGMAATAQRNDYVHQLALKIETRTGGRLRIAPTITNPDGSIALGNANVVNIADIFERGYATYTASKLQAQIDGKPDIVVLQFGENIPMATFDPLAFKNSLQSLVTDLKQSGNPHIFVASYIFSPNAIIDDIKRQIVAEDPTHRVFVDMSGFSLEPSHVGFLDHPSDKGMMFIADTLFNAMVAEESSSNSSVVIQQRPWRWLRRLRCHMSLR